MQSYRIFNTFMGDYIRTVLLSGIVREIQRSQLLDLVKVSGEVLLNGLKKLEVLLLYKCLHVKLIFITPV